MKLQNLPPQGTPPRKPQGSPQPPTPNVPGDVPGNAPDEKEQALRDQLLETIVGSPEFTKEAIRRVGRGDKVSISVDGKPVVSISSEGPTMAERVVGGFRTGIRSVTSEVATVVNNDPAFMLRNAATAVKTQVYSNVPSTIQEVADKALIPFARVASLALDGHRAYQTWTDKESSWVDRGIDTAHVACDLVGVVGAVGPFIFPSLAPHANTMLAVGFAGDIVSYSYRGLQYFTRRSADGNI